VFPVRYELDIYTMQNKVDRPCSLVVRVPRYRSRNPGSIPGATRFSEKWWVWNGVHSASLVQLRSYLEEKAASVQKAENTTVGIRLSDPVAPISANIVTNFAEKLRSLGRYSALSDSGHGVISY
jgi:hypothetical protein